MIRPIFVLVLGLGLAISPLGRAWAHSGGVAASGCGCHGSGTVALSASASPMSLEPGQTATVTITVGSGTAAEAGLFVQADTGQLVPIGGQGMAEVINGLSHTSPKPMSGGQTQFSFQWTAPEAPGAVRFESWAVAANGNGSSSGDAAEDAIFDFVYGCDGQTFYRDFDGDGYGLTSQPRLFCAGTPPAGYAALPDDCNDNRDTTYPGATEYCNQIDDDCDEEIDEDALPVDLYPDGDGDGYYGWEELRSGEMMMGCVPTEGWAAEPGDCEPDNADINPGAEEVCNGFDDDCNVDVDERVRPQCGEGWCRRESLNCDPDNCMPGEPRPEECNFFDDDCDGLLDEDATCPEGESCQAGECRPLPPEPEGVDGSGGATAGDDTGTAGETEGAGQTGDTAGCGCRAPREPGPTSALWLLLLLARPRRAPAHPRSRGRR